MDWPRVGTIKLKKKMNKKQRIVFMLGVLTACICVAYPPWLSVYGPKDGSRPITRESCGYGLITKGKEVTKRIILPNGTSFKYRHIATNINTQLLFVQLLAIIVITALGILVFRSKSMGSLRGH